MLVTNFDAFTGGVQRNSRLILSELNKRGVRTYVCARNYYNLDKNETKDGTVFHRSPVVGSSRAANGIVYLIDTLFWLIVNRKKYDVVHCQQMFGPTMVAAVSSFITGKPILTRITLSGDTGEAKAVRRMPLSSLRVRLIKRVAKWVALSSEMKAELEELGVPAGKIRVIPNSTELPATPAFDEPARSEMRRNLELPYDKIAVFAGRLSEEKGLDTLMEAWHSVNQTCPDAHLLLLGEGGEYRNVEAELKRRCEELGLNGNVHFLGHVANAKDYILACDVFVLPSKAEGMSNALVEAFACGAAIVATDIPANAEICENGANSLLVPVGEPAPLHDAIMRLFDSPDLRERIGRGARSKAERELSVETMINSYIESYREITVSSAI